MWMERWSVRSTPPGGGAETDPTAVKIQAATPGTAQTGNLNITGIGLFGGNVGIGTTTPGTALEVFRNTTGIATFRTDTVDGEINLYAGGQTAENRRFGIYNTGTTFRIRALNDAYNNAADALVITRSNLSVSNVYFPNGNVGIGTTAPPTKLTVGDTSSQNTLMIRGDAATNNAPVLSLFRGGNKEDFIAQISTHGMAFGITNGLGSDYSDANLLSKTNLMISNSGNVGIGATLPSAKLHVRGPDGVSAIGAPSSVIYRPAAG